MSQKKKKLRRRPRNAGRRVNNLVRGHEPEARVRLLFELTRISSEEIRAAIVKHLSGGYSERDAAYFYDVPLSNFSRALARLDEKAGVLEKIKEMDWQRLKAG
jgi:hypothetical protein